MVTMLQARLDQLVQELQISRVEIIREEREILLLNELVKCKLSQQLVFKGGTALRLVYAGPRFSQDLDFSLLSEIDPGKLKQCIEGVLSKIPGSSLDDFVTKRYTHFVLIKITDLLLSQNISIKLEISRRPVSWKYGQDYQVGIATSLTANLAVIINVSTLERMLKDKQHAVKTRSKARDYFDLWYLAHKLDRQIKIPKPNIEYKAFNSELNQLLPIHHRGWAEHFLSS